MKSRHDPIRALKFLTQEEKDKQIALNYFEEILNSNISQLNNFRDSIGWYLTNFPVNAIKFLLKTSYETAESFVVGNFDHLLIRLKHQFVLQRPQDASKEIVRELIDVFFGLLEQICQEILSEDACRFMDCSLTKRWSVEAADAEITASLRALVPQFKSSIDLKKFRQNCIKVKKEELLFLVHEVKGVMDGVLEAIWAEGRDVDRLVHFCFNQGKPPHQIHEALCILQRELDDDLKFRTQVLQLMQRYHDLIDLSVAIDAIKNLKSLKLADVADEIARIYAAVVADRKEAELECSVQKAVLEEEKFQLAALQVKYVVVEKDEKCPNCQRFLSNAKFYHRPNGRKEHASCFSAKR